MDVTWKFLPKTTEVFGTSNFGLLQISRDIKFKIDYSLYAED